MAFFHIEKERRFTKDGIAMPTKSETYDKVYGERLYEEQTGTVTSIYRKLKEHEIDRYETCLQLLPPRVERLLDVGCGGGHLGVVIKERVSEYYGVDISPVLLNQANSNLTRLGGNIKVSLTQCDFDQRLPFEDGFFDAISCIAVLEHVMNPPELVNEIHRVLRPDGFFVVQVPNVAWLPYRIGLLFGRLPLTGGVYLGADWEHLHIFTKKLAVDLLTTKGFEIERVLCSGVFAGYRKWWVSLLGSDIVVKCKKRKKDVM